MGRELRSKPTTLVASGLALAIVGLLPVCFMVVSRFFVDGALSLKNYSEVLANVRTWTLFRNSIVLAALTTAIAGLLGVALGIILARTDLPLRNYLAGLFVLPLVFPPYILAVGWFEVLGRTGILSRWVGQRSAEWTSQWLFSLPGAVVVLAAAFLPVVLLLTMTWLRGMNPSLEEAARLSFGWRQVIRKVTIPLIMPGVLLSMLLVFLLTMGEFGAPSFLRLSVFPVASFTQSSAFYNFGGATAAAMPLIVVVFAGLLAAEKILQGRQHSFRWGTLATPVRIPLGREKPLVLALTVGLAVILVGAPLWGVLWRGFSPAALADAIRRAGSSAVRSALYAGVSATLLLVPGFFLGYFIQRRSLACWRFFDASALFLFTLPGGVVGIGLITLWNRPLTNWIYGTPVILIAAYVAQYAALGMRIVAASFTQVSPSLEEAAQAAAAGWFRQVFGILAPVNRAALLAAWIITFVFCLRDVALPLLLAPAGGDTLTSRTMTLMANGSPELIAALCVLSILVTLLPLGAAGAAWRFRSRRTA
jgi:iron(III) transport system permease protein